MCSSQRSKFDLRLSLLTIIPCLFNDDNQTNNKVICCTRPNSSFLITKVIIHFAYSTSRWSYCLVHVVSEFDLTISHTHQSVFLMVNWVFETSHYPISQRVVNNISRAFSYIHTSLCRFPYSSQFQLLLILFSIFFSLIFLQIFHYFFLLSLVFHISFLFSLFLS